MINLHLHMYSIISIDLLQKVTSDLHQIILELLDALLDIYHVAIEGLRHEIHGSL
jgi:hypothetical protein